MGTRIPDGFAEFRTGKKHIYVRRGLEFLRDYLAAYSYPWPSRPGPGPGSSGPHDAAPSYEGRAALSRIVLDDHSGETALVKHYCRGGLFRRLVRDRYFGKRRFLRELEVGEEARARGVPSIEILALVVEKNGALTHRADLVTREIRDAVDLRTYIERTFPHGDQSERTERFETLLSAVASLLRKMHDAGIYHADLNVKNILVREDAAALRCYIIDLDRARCLQPLSNAERLKNLGRLYRSLEKTGLVPHRIAEPDMKRFVELYCRRDPHLEAEAQRLLRKTSLGLRLHRLLWRFDRRRP